ncbi:MAG: bpX6 domain-containing protein [Polyangiaceae bacterium]
MNREREPLQDLASLTRSAYLTHRGSVLANGFLMDMELVGVGEVRRRVAALPSVTGLLELKGQLVVLLSRPLRVDAASAPGLALVDYGGWLSGLPLDKAGLDQLGAAAPGGTLLVVRAGRAEAHPLSQLGVVDPSDWVDLSAFEWLVAEPLRQLTEHDAPQAGLAAVTEPELLAQAGVFVSATQLEALRAQREAALGSARSVREVLEAQAAEQDQETRGQARSRGAAGSTRSAAFRATSARLLARLLTFVAHLIQPLLRAAPRALPPPPEGSGNRRRKPGEAGLPDTDYTPPGPSWLERLSQRLQGLASQLLMRSQLGSALMRRHAEFLQETLDLLDRGDWDEALKRAIPLGGESTGQPEPPPLGLPSARSELRIQPWRASSSTSSLGLHTDLYEDVRRRYRRAFEALEARGEIEKAAFVLAELLHANEEAVSFLERHKRLKLAAELAEARKLAPGLVVRQWLIAGNRERAMRLAERHGAFADAISRLEQGHPDLALQLRALWADRLASAGDYVGAVDAAWGVKELRALAVHWAELASQVGGTVTARMLLRLLRLAPQRAPQLFERVESLSSELAEHAEDDAAWLMLRTLGEELARAAERQATWHLPPEEARSFARLLAPRLLSALGRRGEGVPGRRTPVRDVLELCEDPVLDFSLSHAKGEGTKALPPRVLNVERGASDVGSLPIHDAVLLPGGNYLVALGEIGLWVVNARGKVMQRFAEPTQRIVISRHGDRAILLARRGEMWRLSRLDLVARRIQPWRDARIDVFATEFDGQRWVIARNDLPGSGWANGGELLAIDVTQEWEAESLLRDDRPVLAINVGAECIRSVIHDEVWEHELPGLTLRRRTPLPDLGVVVSAAVSVDGEVCVAAQSQATDFKGFALKVFTSSAGIRHVFPESPTVGAPVLARRLAVPLVEERSFLGHVFDLSALTAGSHLAHVRLEGRDAAPKGSMRLCGEQLLIFDDHGRLLHGDLARRVLVGELRLAL